MNKCRNCGVKIIPSWKLCRNCDTTCLHDIDLEPFRKQEEAFYAQQKALTQKQDTIQRLITQLAATQDETLHYKHEMERYQKIAEALLKQGTMKKYEAHTLEAQNSIKDKDTNKACL